MAAQSESIHRGVVAEITEAVEAYEDAIARHDLDALRDWFLDDPATVRAGANGVLVGRDQIDEFRRRAPRTPSKRVEQLHVVPLGESIAMAVAETRRDDGSPGLQTQAWVKTLQGWKISVAHVSNERPTEPAVQGELSSTDDKAVWRVSGSPLVAGATTGPLAGRSVAVKDLFAVAGHAIGAGNPAWLAEADVELASAPAVQALLAAGADVIGIAQTDEFAYSLSGTNIHYGTPPNPAAPGRVPGGSSSGPASAVALGLVDIGLGSDTAGSIRVPASYCGLFGLRTSHGAVPTTGVLPLAPAFDTVGWLTQDYETLAVVATALLPEDKSPRPERLLLAEDVFALADPAVQDALRRPVQQLADQLGLPFSSVPSLCHGHMDEWVAAFRTVQATQAWQVHGPWLEQHPDVLEPEIAQRFADGRAVTPDELRAAEDVLVRARAVIGDQVQAGTVLVQPAASTPAPPPHMSATDKGAMRAGTLRLTSLASVAGLPSLALPVAHVGSLPVGLCLVAPRGTDRSLVALARHVSLA